MAAAIVSLSSEGVKKRWPGRTGTIISGVTITCTGRDKKGASHCGSMEPSHSADAMLPPPSPDALA